MVHSINTVSIDFSALIHNLSQVKKLLSPETKIMGIVKSDAYGHGMVQVSKELASQGVYSLGVAFFHEALELRRHGLALPITILCGIRTREEAMEVVERGLTPVVFDMCQIEFLIEECARRGRETHMQVKVDTGMGRLGIGLDGLVPFLRKVKGHRGVIVDGLTSHFSSADEPARDFTLSQIKKFREAVEEARAMGFPLPLNNLANSAGIMGYRESHYDMVRPGILLYGGLPSPGMRSPLELKPVMQCKGKILQIKELPDHSPVSYSRTYYTKGTRRIGVLSAGYGEGLPRSLSNAGKVLIRGMRAAIVGNVCMNMLMTDISDIKDAAVGDEVVFLGAQGKEKITGDEVAGWAKTISYEVYCSIGARVKGDQ